MTERKRALWTNRGRLYHTALKLYIVFLFLFIDQPYVRAVLLKRGIRRNSHSLSAAASLLPSQPSRNSFWPRSVLLLPSLKFGMSIVSDQKIFSQWSHGWTCCSHARQNVQTLPTQYSCCSTPMPTALWRLSRWLAALPAPHRPHTKRFCHAYRALQLGGMLTSMLLSQEVTYDGDVEDFVQNMTRQHSRVSGGCCDAHTRPLPPHPTHPHHPIPAPTAPPPSLLEGQHTHLGLGSRDDL